MKYEVRKIYTVIFSYNTLTYQISPKAYLCFPELQYIFLPKPGFTTSTLYNKDYQTTDMVEDTFTVKKPDER